MSQGQSAEMIPTNKQFPKLSKATSGYLEIEMFRNSDLKTGYFCDNCMYYLSDNRCAVVENTGPDVRGEESGRIAPYGVCTLWNPNEEVTR